MRQEEEDDLMPTAMSPDQLSDKSPHAQLQLLWLNFKVARRHLVRVSNFEAQTEAELNPMHVVQNDETLSSIARARFLWSMSCARGTDMAIDSHNLMVNDPCRHARLQDRSSAK